MERHILDTKAKRIIGFSLAWIVFALVSTKIYSNFIQDVSAPFWFAGILAYPIVLLLYLVAERKLYDVVTKNTSIFFATAVILAILSYPVWLFIGFFVLKIFYRGI